MTRRRTGIFLACATLSFSACSAHFETASEYAYSACYEFDGKNENNIAQAAQMDAKYLELLDAFERRATSADFYTLCDAMFGK